MARGGGARGAEGSGRWPRRSLWHDSSAVAQNHDKRFVYGPFHRLLAPRVQDAATIVKQLLSGEVWGRKPSWGGSPQVKAYTGTLPQKASGFEFWAFQPPDVRHGPKGLWYSAGPYVTIDEMLDVVKLQIAFVTITQDLHFPSS